MGEFTTFLESFLPSISHLAHRSMFHDHKTLVCTATAQLFHVSATGDFPVGDEYKSKVRAIGNLLDAHGGLELMRITFYAILWLVQKFEHDVNGCIEWTTAFTTPIEAAFDGVGEWQF